MSCGEQSALAFFCGIMAIPVMLVLALEWVHRPWWLRVGADRHWMKPRGKT